MGLRRVGGSRSDRMPDEVLGKAVKSFRSENIRGTEERLPTNWFAD